MNYTQRLSLLCILASSFAYQCKSSQRATPDDSDNRTVSIRLSGLDDSDKARPDLSYELGGCTTPKLTGILKPDGRVAFVSKNLRARQTCNLSVKSMQAAGETRFTWLDGAAGTLYGASDILIRNDVDGTLAGTAALSKNYQIKSSNFFTLSLPAAFPEPIKDDQKYTAEMNCKPAIQAVALLKKDSSASGLFEFQEPLSIGEEKSFSCTLVAVWVNQALRYRGVFNASGSPITITAKGGSVVKPVASAIVFQTIPLDQEEDPTQIIVSTVEGSCAADEVFDVQAGKCIQKPVVGN